MAIMIVLVFVNYIFGGFMGVWEAIICTNTEVNTSSCSDNLYKEQMHIYNQLRT